MQHQTCLATRNFTLQETNQGIREMAQSFLLQDWITINGPAGVDTVLGEAEWLDLSEFTDLAFYLSIRAVGGSGLQLLYETSPTRDNDLFGAMVTKSGLAVTSRAVDIIRFASASEPLARMVRWRLTGATAAYNITFRIWLVCVATA